MILSVGSQITAQTLIPSSDKGEAQRSAPNVLTVGKKESTGSPLSTQLSEEEEKQVEKLKKIDTEVRAHEQSHKSVAGPYAGPISYETVTGPDGREYAIGGHVDIDISPIPNNPEATIRKMDIIIRAALAPSEPSSEDFAAARAAQQARAQAQKELQEQRDLEKEEVEDKDSTENLNVISQESENPIATDIFQSIKNLLASDSDSRFIGTLFSSDA